jgi:hypothetical protein
VIAEAALAVDEALAAVEAANWERYAWVRVLHATDEVLWRLEEFNLAGCPRISKEVWGRLRASLRELPAEALELLAGPPDVQQLINGVYRAQDWLLRLRNPDLELDEEEVA